jgi:hypothetical protein
MNHHHNNSWLSQFRSLHPPPPPNTPKLTPLLHLLSAKRRHPPAVSSTIAATNAHSGSQYDNVMVQEAASTLEHILLEIQTDVATLMKDRGENVRKEGNDDDESASTAAVSDFVTTNEERVLNRWDIATVRECIRPLQRYLLHHCTEEIGDDDDDVNMYDRWSLLLDEAHMVLWLHPYVTSSLLLLQQQKLQNHSVVQSITASIQRTIHTINTTTTMLDLFLYDHHHHLLPDDDDNDDDRNTAAVVITVPTTILELPRVLRQCVVGRPRRRRRTRGNGSFVRQQQQQQQQQYDILLIYLWCQLATDTMPIATVTTTPTSPQLEWNEHLYQHILQYTQYRPISSYNTLLQATMAMYQYDQYLLDGRMALPPPTLSMIQNSFFNLHDKYVCLGGGVCSALFIHGDESWLHNTFPNISHYFFC